MKRILIFGESPLVEEYSSLCLNKKLEVHARINPSTVVLSKASSLPKGTKKVAKPVRSVDVALELTNTSLEDKKKSLAELDNVLAEKIPILSSSVTVTLEEQASWVQSPSRLVGIGALPSLLQGSLMEMTVANSTEAKYLERAKEFASALGKEHAVVHDAAGMVLPRIICMLVNEACFAMAEGVASGREIDTAMKLGTSYPHGPLEWAGRIGIRQVHAVIGALYRAFGEDRYRIAPLLQQAAFRNAFPVR